MIFKNILAKFQKSLNLFLLLEFFYFNKACEGRGIFLSVTFHLASKAEQ